MLLTNSFISEISLSTSSMNWIMKSTSLCFNISSVWKFVIRKEMSYPYSDGQSPPWSGVSRSPRKGGGQQLPGPQHRCRKHTHFDRFPPQDEERLGALFQEPGELVYQDVLDLVSLLDLEADAHAVDAGLDEDALVLVTRNRQGRQKDLWRRPGLDFGDIVSLGGLGCEVGQAEGGCQAAADGLKVRPKGLRLGGVSAVHWQSADLRAAPYHLEGTETLPGLFKMPSWRGAGRSGCPEKLSPNGATSTSPGVGRQERRDLPAESGEGMKVRTVFAGAPVLPPSPPPCRTFPYAATH